MIHQPKVASLIPPQLATPSILIRPCRKRIVVGAIPDHDRRQSVRVFLDPVLWGELACRDADNEATAPFHGPLVYYGGIFETVHVYRCARASKARRKPASVA